MLLQRNSIENPGFWSYSLPWKARSCNDESLQGDMPTINALVKARIEQYRTKGGGELDLASNGLTEVPDEVFGLSQLGRLSLEHNDIQVIPDRIRDLSNLKRLKLGYNPIEKTPDIPGLMLDWPSYMRCRGGLSPENIA